MAQDQKEIAKRMERKYPDYWYESGEVYCNPTNHLLYVSAHMRKKARCGDKVTIAYELLEGICLPCGGRTVWTVEQITDRAGKPWAKIQAGKQTAFVPAISLVVVRV